jgi:beta-phosphoglucomutase-like phosphatase (HAD superfamily)
MPVGSSPTKEDNEVMGEIGKRGTAIRVSAPLNLKVGIHTLASLLFDIRRKKMRSNIWMGLYLLTFILPAFESRAQAIPTVDINLPDQIINDVRDSYNKRQRPMVIFDLDGTLFDNRSRISFIIKEYATKELKGIRPEDEKKIQAIELSDIKYMLTATLQAAGVTDAAVVNNASVFWSERFFQDAYLQHDTPTPGSVNFVRTLYSTGARIIYLSGRDSPRQLIGTVRALRDHGYPIGIQSTELIMKPTIQTQDAIFKQHVTNYLRHYGKIIATFDNEPANANVYKRAFSDATVVLYEAPHRPNPPPLLKGIQKLEGF